MQLEWKIWFWDYVTDDFVTHTNITTPIDKLPILGVVAIVNVVREPGIPPRWCMEWKTEFYTLMKDNMWWARNYSGLLNYLDGHRGDGFAVLRGGMVSNKAMSSVEGIIMTDPELKEITTERFVRDPYEGGL